jgi:uncharacterized membrane protein YeiH
MMTQDAVPKERHQIVDIDQITKRLGVRLTQTEFEMLQHKVDANGDGQVSLWELTSAGHKALSDRSAREVCLSVIEKPTSTMDRVGANAITVCDYGGTALYAIVGCQTAGLVGMNLVGCTLVGCASAIGGGTLNGVLYGSASTLHRRPGVFWVRHYAYLVVSVVASFLTFYLWPVYCRYHADHYLMDVVGEENLEPDGSIGREAFLRSCATDAEFLASMQASLGKDERSAKELFQLLDYDKSGTVNRGDLRKIVQNTMDNSLEMYAVDTLALSAFAVSAVHGAISVGVHPLVACTSGITVCFGGILRDIFCGHNLAIGGQSYAFATGAGSTVYVALRELALRGIPTSLFTRVICAAGTTASLRVWEYLRGEPLLAPMHGYLEYTTPALQEHQHQLRRNNTNIQQSDVNSQLRRNNTNV